MDFSKLNISGFMALFDGMPTTEKCRIAETVSCFVPFIWKTKHKCFEVSDYGYLIYKTYLIEDIQDYSFIMWLLSQVSPSIIFKILHRHYVPECPF